MGLVSLVRPGFGVDLGTANTVVYHPARGVVLNEPSVMVVRPNGDHVLAPVAVGSRARELMGRTPAGMETVRPLRDGVITDLVAAKTFITAMLRRVRAQPWEKLRPRAVIGVPAGATSLERQALLEAAEEADLGRVHLMPEPIAGAVGAGLDPTATRAQMVVDVGGGTAEITAFCFGGVLASRSCRIAGDEMTAALCNYLRQEHGLLAGELTVEEAKKGAGAGRNGSVRVEGRDAASGRPRAVELKGNEVSNALAPTVDAIVEALTASLAEDLPPQAVADIMNDGVVAFGGGSLLRGFGPRLEEALGFKVRVADDALLCVARGAAVCLSRPALLKAFSPPN
jgi:rod shape-determining protein MreB and related proteins